MNRVLPQAPQRGLGPHQRQSRKALAKQQRALFTSDDPPASILATKPANSGHQLATTLQIS